MKVDLFTFDGEKKGTVSLPKEIFEIEANEGLMHEALLRQRSNARIDTAFTKTRTEVRGGGRKPWKQKGTGRARQGSIRSPQWRGGGVVFGPRADRNYEKQMPKKMRRKALLSALSVVAKGKRIVALESFDAETPKTKSAVHLLSQIGDARRTLIVTSGRHEVLEKSFRNLQNVKTLFANYLNIADLLSADRIIFLTDALAKTEEIFGKK